MTRRLIGECDTTGGGGWGGMVGCGKGLFWVPRLCRSASGVLSWKTRK